MTYNKAYIVLNAIKDGKNCSTIPKADLRLTTEKKTERKIEGNGIK